MAVSQGSKLLHSDVRSWYDKFNSLSTMFGISTMAVPAANSSALATNINNLQSKINIFRNDTYLSTQINFWPAGSPVSVGSLITPSAVSNIVTAAGNVSKVVCRNQANNTKGANSYGIKGSGPRSYGNNNNIDKTNSVCENGSYSNVTCNNATCNYGAQGNGTCSKGTKSNTMMSCGTYGNGKNSVTCNKTSCSRYVGGGLIPYHTCGTDTSGTCSRTYRSCGQQSNGTYTQGDNSNGTLSNRANSNGTKTNGAIVGGKQSGYCSYGSIAVNLSGNSTTCTSGNYQSGTHSNGVKSSGGTLELCSSGTKSNQTYSNDNCSDGTYGQGTNANIGAGSGIWVAYSNGSNGNGTQSFWTNGLSATVCRDGTNANSTYGYTTKTNTKTIDILCTLGTKSNN